jgi:hypothetical protein
MRTTLAIALAATGLLLGMGTAGTMAQTPSGSQSQSAPPGKDMNPAMMPDRSGATVIKKKRIHARRRIAPTTGTGSQSQSAPPGKDMNPATGSR